MQTRRWVNPSQPQTLQIAVILFYINAAFTAIFGGLFSLIGLLLIAGMVASGYGMANERKWGYVLGLVIAGIGLALSVVLPLVFDVGLIFDAAFLIGAIFPVALFALLVHPISREYQRIWFE